MLLPLCRSMRRTIAAIRQETWYMPSRVSRILSDLGGNWTHVSVCGCAQSSCLAAQVSLSVFNGCTAVWTVNASSSPFIRFRFSFHFCSFNVIIAFATNYLLQQGVENATTTARYGVSDTQEFLHTTSLQSNHILVKNYEELTDHLELMLKGMRYAPGCYC